jgi:DNA-binding transcriptional ArsR family regulator
MAAHSEMDDVFRALADPSRRRLLDSLNGRNGQTLRELCAGLEMARQSVSKHLAVLEAANLVTTVRRGREKLHYLNAAPINDIAERWINRYDRERVHALADLKRALEDTTMQKPSFVYTTYIETTPEKLWRALTDPAFTRRYWDTILESDWEVGSAMTWHHHGVTIAEPGQVVLESEPYRRLAYTWHTFTPEWAEAVGVDDASLATIAEERRSKVTFDIEPLGEIVKLTVVHDDFDPGSTVLELVSQGWPRLLSDLKTLLETGETLMPERAARSRA